MPARPNPSPGPAEFEFLLGSSARVALSLHDVAGRRIANLANGAFTAGPHRVVWDGRTVEGGAVPSGLYFVELRTEAECVRRSVLVVR